jgi:hypothetical protein
LGGSAKTDFDDNAPRLVTAKIGQDDAVTWLSKDRVRAPQGRLHLIQHSVVRQHSRAT